MRRTGASSKPRLLAAAISVVAIGVVALLLPATAGASGTASTSTLQDGGVLSLHLGSSGNPPDYFGFRAPDGSGGYAPTSTTQSITNAQGCKIALAGGSNQLVTLTPTGGSNPNTGFVSDAIGVVSSGEGNGQPCGRIDRATGQPSQTLTMNLGSAAGGKVIDYAEIDLELKFGATVRITGLLDGVQVGSAEDYASVGSDSGPDSADGDNYRVRFPRSGKTAVNALKFEIWSSSGGASLEGGADGTAACDPTDIGECANPDGSTGFSLGQTLSGTTDSLFHLVNADGVLACGSTATQGGTGGTPTTTIERLNNDGTSSCVGSTPIPYNQDSTNPPGPDQFAFFQKDLGGQPAQFYWTITWAPETGSYMEDETQFDFGFGLQTLQLCLADGPDVNSYPDLPPKAVGSPAGSPDPDPWCVVNTATVLDPATGLVTVTEKYFGKNDPTGHRG